MPFNSETIKYITEYVENHLPDEDWYDEYFDFVRDEVLASRLKIEFKNARYIYKIFEGLQVKDELLLAQVRTQIIMYVSIYEALIHYLLFDFYKNTEVVDRLLEKPTAVRINIPAHKLKTLEETLKHDRKEIIPY